VSERKTEPAFLERDGWRHKDEWSRRHESFMVVVSRHSSSGDDNLWCVYIYIYPKHPDFARFDASGSTFDNALFDCHSYCSFYKAHRKEDGEICSHQIGWDYNHAGDHRYTQYATASAASVVFYDASQLFDDAKERYEEARAALQRAEGEGQ
jgi:hypothetical protein